MTGGGGMAAWLRGRPDCEPEPGLDRSELDRAEAHFGIRFAPRWRAVLSEVHPVSVPRPPPNADGTTSWTPFPDWRLRDEPGTRALVERPVQGLLLDVEHGGFWWSAWGPPPAVPASRVAVAAAQLAAVPRLTPLWGHLYVAASDDSPVFSIVQADLYIPALTIADLPTGRNQGAVPVAEWPIGRVPFWSELHAYAQLGHPGPFAHPGAGGL